MHQAAPRWHRREMMLAVKKYCQEFEGVDFDALGKKVEEIAGKFEDKWIEQNTDEDALPLFEFDINLNEKDE